MNVKIRALLRKLTVLFSLALVMVAGVCIAGRTEAHAAVGGSCGRTVSWYLDDISGSLYISGSGAMYDFTLTYSANSSEEKSSAPWVRYSDQILYITVAKGVTGIGDYAFYGCKNATYAVIADTVTDIGTGAFNECTALNNIMVNEANTTFSSIDGSLYNADGTTLLQYAIGKQEESFTVPDGVTTIGNSAFKHALNLKSVTVSNTVTLIDRSAFVGCSNLTNVNFGYGVKTVSDYAFYGCLSLKRIELPYSVRTIGEHAFGLCYSLDDITLQDGVRTIGAAAFDMTDYVKNADNWENHVLYIGNHIIDVDEKIKGVYTIKDGTRTIANDAFSYCEHLTGIVIPESVVSIGKIAFRYCEQLTSAVFKSPDGWQNNGKELPASDMSKENTAAYFLTVTYCSNSFVRETEHEHVNVTNVIAPTCVQVGYTVYVCSICDNAVVSNETETVGHVASDWIIDTMPEVGVEGSRHKECTYCTLIMETEMIPELTEEDVNGDQGADPEPAPGSSCFSGLGSYISYFATVFIPAAFVFLGKFFLI